MKEPEIKLPPTEQWIERKQSGSRGYDPITETHPSYGIIGIHHSFWSRTLFDSDVVHQHFISISIKNAQRVIDGTHEHIMGTGQELIEIHMTEAQFAQLIARPNVGDGVPCTINHCKSDFAKAETEPWVHPRHGGRPDPPEPEKFDLKFKKETGERAQIIVDALNSLQSMIDKFLSGEEKPNKTTLKTLKGQVSSALLQIQSNLPWVQEVAAEQLEKKIASAIVEFESFVNMSLQRRGLAAMQNEAPRLSVPLVTNEPVIPLLGD